MPFPALLHGKAHLQALVGVLRDAGGGTGRQLQLSHREGVQHGLGVLPGLAAENEERHGLQADVSVVGDGERAGKAVRQDEVVVPLLDAESRRLDRGAVIVEQKAPRPAGLPQFALRVQQGLTGRDLVIAHGQSSSRRQRPSL